MTRFIMPIILIGISVAVFFMFTNPIYGEIGQLRAESDSYNKALDNSKALENERDSLTQKKSAMDPANLVKLEKLLPESVDNIRLILEIEQIALPYGMTLKDVKYSSSAVSAPPAAGSTPVAKTVTSTTNSKDNNKDYGTWDLSFSTTGSYSNFLNFTRDLESNLRIVDISSIQFSSGVAGAGGSGASGSSPESYKYDFKIKTYWLKN